MRRLLMITTTYAGLCAFDSMLPNAAEAFELPAQPVISRIATDYYQDAVPQDGNAVVPDDVDEANEADEADEADDQPIPEADHWAFEAESQTNYDLSKDGQAGG